MVFLLWVELQARQGCPGISRNERDASRRRLLGVTRDIKDRAFIKIKMKC